MEFEDGCSVGTAEQLNPVRCRRVIFVVDDQLDRVAEASDAQHLEAVIVSFEQRILAGSDAGRVQQPGDHLHLETSIEHVLSTVLQSLIRRGAVGHAGLRCMPARVVHQPVPVQGGHVTYEAGVRELDAVYRGRTHLRYLLRQ
ncbi:MAG TPA: hypothetical protein VD907_06465 [Verrucomicrobiae bacterium]|nr:hypothetical protein [Verrucomicrobiae bacterium]